MTSVKNSKKPPSRKQVFLVEDHPIVRHGLAELLNREPDFSVCGEAEDVADALVQIDALQPDIVLVDLSLKKSNGLDLIKDMKIRHPRIPALVLSMHDEAFYAERALRAGARGYVMKQQAIPTIADAIRRVLEGHVHISTDMVNTMLQRVVRSPVEEGSSPFRDLSDRESDVLRLVGEGYSSPEIAEQLHLSVKTIESYRDHLKKKLGLRTTSELLRYAIKWVRGDGAGK